MNKNGYFAFVIFPETEYGHLDKYGVKPLFVQQRRPVHPGKATCLLIILSRARKDVSCPMASFIHRRYTASQNSTLAEVTSDLELCNVSKSIKLKN